MDPKIVVVGSCMTDMFSYTPRLPKPGETLHGTRFNCGFGGKGANQCIAAAKLGTSVAFVAKVGDDYYGKNYLDNLKKHEVDVSNVSVTDQSSTGVATISVDEQGENSIIIIAGANLLMSKNDVSNAEELIKKSKLVVCQGEISDEATLHAFQLANKYNVSTLLNAAPASKSIDPQLLALTDILCVNETEAEAISSHPVTCLEDAKQCAPKLIEFGVKRVIITLGAEGAFYYDHTSQYHIPTTPVKSVDTTGAGDCFTGALAYYLVEMPNLDIQEKLSRSCQVAAISVQAYGTQSSFPNKKDIPNSLFL